MKVDKTPFCIYGLYFVTFFVFFSPKRAKIQKCFFPRASELVTSSRTNFQFGGKTSAIDRAAVACNRKAIAITFHIARSNNTQ